MQEVLSRPWVMQEVLLSQVPVSWSLWADMYLRNKSVMLVKVRVTTRWPTVELLVALASRGLSSCSGWCSCWKSPVLCCGNCQAYGEVSFPAFEKGRYTDLSLHASTIVGAKEGSKLRLNRVF